MKNLYALICLLVLGSLSQQATAQTQIHSWKFNNTSNTTTLLTPSSLIGGASLTYVLGSGGSTAITNGNGNGFTTNDSTHLRFNAPVDGNLIFSIPTTEYMNAKMTYMATRSGSGPTTQKIYYSTDGSTYTLNQTVVVPAANSNVLVTIDFDAIPEADNNANLKVKIEFELGGNPANTGNQRMDNVSVLATSVYEGDVTAPTATLVPVSGATYISLDVNPTITLSETVRLANNSAIDNDNVDALVELRLNDAAGDVVSFNASYSNKVITIVPNTTLVNGQTYYLALKENVLEDMNNNAAALHSGTFTTEPVQTTLHAGDLAIVAYRMNALATDDEFVFVPFVNLLGGTRITFTDAKYTDNATAQCPEGLIWTAPLAGVAAGTAISIQCDGGTSSSGTLTGSTFGLSSGGDQVIAYTGKNTAANHVFAMSSNAFVANNASCGGSSSKLPATLALGTSAISLSTAQGNGAGNTVNAYYNGSQEGSLAEIKVAVMDPANWIGIGAGNEPQTFPGWNFPGPPSVTSVTPLTQTSLQVVFSKSLNDTSATNFSHYTGISGLANAVLSNNGELADTVLLTYNTPFLSGANNVISISNVRDEDLQPMFAAYEYSFSYDIKLAFDKKSAIVSESAGSVVLKLKITNPGSATVQLNVKEQPFSTASSEDALISSQLVEIDETDGTSILFTIPIVDDQVAEGDEYLVVSLSDANGATIEGIDTYSLFIQDNDELAPEANQSIQLSYINSFDPLPETGSSAEIVVYDNQSKRIFITSAIQDRLDIADFTDPEHISLVRSIDMSPYGGITSVAVKRGIVAVASPGMNEQDNGSVVFFNNDGDFLKQLTVGALPDMVCFTPDASMVLTANEGQPADNYSVDPEGSVSVIDISAGIEGLTQSHVTTMYFTQFNADEEALMAAGIRKGRSSSTLSRDIEPEYITIDPSSKKAWVSLQESNAIGEIDLIAKNITTIWPLGQKDYSLSGNAFDASDKGSSVMMANWPVKGYYMPDGIAYYTSGATKCIVTANEGDEREYSALNERTTVSAMNLDSATFPNAAMLKEDFAIGRLRATKLNGDVDGDGDYDQICIPGGRSFSIFNAETHEKVYDSGDDFERIIAADPVFGSMFNADHESNTKKVRSRSKGPEPEGVTTARINNRTFAFISLERIGGVMVYDVTYAKHPKFVDYKNSRTAASFGGDHGPEGITYISKSQSPDGKAYILVANEISGTVSVFEILGIQNSTLGLEEENETADKTIRFYPNPVAKNEMLRFSETCSVSVNDISGKEVYRSNQANELKIGNWPAGVYFIQLGNGPVQKLVIK